MARWYVRCIGLILGLWVAAFCRAESTPLPEVLKLDRPVAYCLSTLNQCSPDQQIAFAGPAPSDLRQLNGNTQDPVTLVFNLPVTSIANPNDAALLVSSGYRNHCFRFDYQPQNVHCSEKQLLQIPVHPAATQVFSQLVQSTDIRIINPSFIYGSQQALQAKIQTDRTPVIGLAGWYVFLILATLGQLATQRNWRSTISLALFAITLFLRTIVVSSYNFGSIDLFGAIASRRIELLTLPLLCIFALEFYGLLIGERLKKTRRALQLVLLLVCLSVLVASDMQHHFINLRLAQYLSMPALILVFFQVAIASHLLSMRERVVMFAGLVVTAVGAVVDLYMALSNLPMFFGIGIFAYCFAFEALCQFVLIALRYDKAQNDAQIYQSNLIQVQGKLVDSLRTSEQELAEKVELRTAELKAANTQIYQAYTEAEESRLQADMARQIAEQAQKQAEVSSIFAEEAQQQTSQAIEDLKAAQAQLVQSEKMASLGLLVSNVAHEINTPIGAVKSSGAIIADSLHGTLGQLPRLFELLDSANSALFMQLIGQTKLNTAALSTREERVLTKQVTAQLEQEGVEGAVRKARLIMKFRAHASALSYLPLLNHPESDYVLSVAAGIADIISSAGNINSAVDRVSRIVFSLKALSGSERTGAFCRIHLNQSIEKVVAAYQGQMQDVDVVRRYQDMEPLMCDPDEMAQVWTHLILNALQAMNHRGTLMIGLRCINNHAEIKVADFGCGIPEDNLSRIFDAFYTTRTSGEGSGMGLAIVKKIVEKHRGTIDVKTGVGQGTTFTVLLPYPTAMA